MLLKRIAVCLLVAVLCVAAVGCALKKPQSQNAATNPLQTLPQFPSLTAHQAVYTPVYASAFGDTVVLATVPVEEWDSLKRDCPAREISNGGRVQCNDDHEEEVNITRVVILDDLIPRVCSGWFRDMVHLEKIEGLEKLHTHEVSNMSYMFAGCTNLAELDLSSWDVSNVIDMTDMFQDCHALETLPDWYKE